MSGSNRIVPSLLLQAATLALIALPAHAKDPPAMLEGIPGVTYEGKIGGMDAWSREGDDTLWLQTADGAHVVAGVLFNKRGVDLGAAIRGQDGVKIEDILGEGPSVESRTETASTDQPATEPPRLSPSADALMASIGGDGAEGAASAYLDAQDALSALPQEARTQALISLVQSIDAATTQEEFNRAVADWQQLVADLVLENTGATVALPAGTSAVSAEDREVVVASSEDRFLDDLASRTFWFSIGSVGAPTVYAVIDPTCPYCARAMNNMKADVESGNIELRIILAPLISERAPDVIAGILTQEDPVTAFWEHELDFAAGGRGVDPVSFANLPEDYQGAIRTNYEMAVESDLPGVPYFIYENQSGEQRFSGVPQAGQFGDALALPDR